MQKVILVTGASSGIGRSTALHLASLGHVVYGAARRMDKLQELESHGVKPIQLDICKHDQCQQVVDTIIKQEGRIDVLVNNAGFPISGTVEDVPIDDARRQFEVNLFGLAAITKCVIPHMREKESGRIINISSMGGVITFPLGSWYHATKFALEGWSDVLRMELMPFNIPVIVIQPGAIQTEFGEKAQSNFYVPEGSAYKKFIEHMQKVFTSGNRRGSDPMVIAKVIEQAALSKNPKTRYVAGAMARPLLFIRKISSDIRWSRTMLKMFFGVKPNKKYRN